MINNYEHVVGYYTDVFGNEIDEYEQVYKYTISTIGTKLKV